MNASPTLEERVSYLETLLLDESEELAYAYDEDGCDCELCVPSSPEETINDRLQGGLAQAIESLTLIAEGGTATTSEAIQASRELIYLAQNAGIAPVAN